MANESYNAIKVVTRATYNNKSASGEIDASTIYFVIEDAASSELYLSLYVGTSRQADIVDLNNMMGFTDADSSQNLTDLFGENDIPTKDMLTTDKLYYWQDLNLDVVKAYIKSRITGEVLPLYGTPVWETIEST